MQLWPWRSNRGFSVASDIIALPTFITSLKEPPPVRLDLLRLTS